MFTERQYRIARDAIWRGAQRRKDGLHDFKSVYSIFVSRVDVYTEEHVTDLSPAAQGMVGIVNAKRIWRENQEFWKDKGLRLQQEIVFASTGVKKPGDPPDKYVEAFAGGDIQTNPPATNEAVEKSPKTYTRHIDQMPSPSIVSEIDRKVDMVELERVLMEEGIKKFAEPQKALIRLIAQKRAARQPFTTSYQRSLKSCPSKNRFTRRRPGSSPSERKRLAPKPAEAFKAFSSERVCRRGASRENETVDCRGRGARDAVPVLHPRTYQRRPSARCDGGGDHGSHLGRRRNACRRRIRTFGFGTGYDRARSEQEKRAFVNA